MYLNVHHVASDKVSISNIHMLSFHSCILSCWSLTTHLQHSHHGWSLTTHLQHSHHGWSLTTHLQYSHHGWSLTTHPSTLTMAGPSPHTTSTLTMAGPSPTPPALLRRWLVLTREPEGVVPSVLRGHAHLHCGHFGDMLRSLLILSSPCNKGKTHFCTDSDLIVGLG